MHTRAVLLNLNASSFTTVFVKLRAGKLVFLPDYFLTPRKAPIFRALNTDFLTINTLFLCFFRTK